MMTPTEIQMRAIWRKIDRAHRRGPSILVATVVAGLSTVNAPNATAAGACTNLFKQDYSSWQSCVQSQGVDCERIGSGAVGSGYLCTYPDGSHDECIRMDVDIAKVTGTCMWYAPGVVPSSGW